MAQYTVSRAFDSNAATFAAKADRVRGALAEFAADVLAPSKLRGVARLLIEELCDFPLPSALTSTWADVRPCYAHASNALRLAEGLLRRARRADHVAEARAAQSSLWAFIWSWNVDVDAASPAQAHVRLSLVDPYYRPERSSSHAA